MKKLRLFSIELCASENGPVFEPVFCYTNESEVKSNLEHKENPAAGGTEAVAQERDPEDDQRPGG